MTPARLRIADFSTHVSGPLASHLLAELGADVIKVEDPRVGDGNRGTPPSIAGAGMLHAALNSGARSLALDRRSRHWASVVAACGRWADAVIVGTRPADAVRRGIDFPTFQKANNRVIYCAISGFGVSGPLSNYVAHGQTIDGLAGLVPVEWVGDSPETRRGWRSAGTTLAGVFAALGILDALYRRQSGVAHAQYVSVSIWGSSMWWQWRDLTMLANTGEAWPDYTDFGSRHALYATSDKRALLIAPAERRFWERFCDVLGLPAEWKSRGNWDGGMDCGEGPAYAEERQAIAHRIRSRTLREWTMLLERAEIPFAPILTPQEALNSEHAGVTGVMQETHVNGRTVKIPRVPIGRSVPPTASEMGTALHSAPALGEHNESILRELGLPELAARLKDEA